jgi:hypothetical protein
MKRGDEFALQTTRKSGKGLCGSEEGVAENDIVDAIWHDREDHAE